MVFLVWILSCLNTADAQADKNYIILDGTHSFASGDNMTWASMHFDDSKWLSIIVPGSWQSQGIKSGSGLGWYRLHFTAPESFRKINPALLLGRIGDADEVFLNGVKIGGEGLIRESFVEATKVQRLYAIPANLLRYNQENVIAVRVMNTYLNGGIFDKNITIGDYNLLLTEKLKRDKYVIVVEFCLFTLFALFFMACLFFYIKGLRDSEYIYFWFFITLYGALFFIGSLTFYDTGLKTRFVQQIINAIATFLPASLLLFLLHFYKEKPTVYMKGIIVSFIGLVLMTAFSHAYAVRIFLYTAWKILFIVTAAFLVFVAIRALLRQLYESGTIFIGIVGLIVGFILESLGGIDLVYITGFFLWDYATVFFMLCVMYALTSRYTRIKELQSASVKIFNAA